MKHDFHSTLECYGKLPPVRAHGNQKSTILLASALCPWPSARSVVTHLYTSPAVPHPPRQVARQTMLEDCSAAILNNCALGEQDIHRPVLLAAHGGGG